MAIWSRNRGTALPEVALGGMSAQIVQRGKLGRVAGRDTTGSVVSDAKASKRRAVPWQEKAYEFFDTVPEVKYLVRRDGNAVSKIRLVPAIIPEPGAEPLLLDDENAGVDPGDVKTAQAELARLRDSLGGQAELLEGVAIHFRLAGECWLLAYPATEAVEEDLIMGRKAVPARPERWELRSALEIEVDDQGKAKIIHGDGKAAVEVADDVLVARLWKSHPRRRSEADSHLRSVLLQCEALLTLDKAVLAVAKSRVAFGGVFVTPAEVSFGSQDPTRDTPDSEEDDDPLTQEIIDHFSTPHRDDGSASCLAPYVYRPPAEYCSPEFTRFIEFPRGVDKQAQAERVQLVKRIAQGTDQAPEELTGMSDSNHWDAWLITAEGFSRHLEPLVLSICSAFTVSVFRLLLEDAGMAPELIARMIVWYDASELISQPNREENAKDAWDRGVIDDPALRKALGQDEQDAPDDADEAAAQRRLGGSQPAQEAPVSDAPPDNRQAAMGDSRSLFRSAAKRSQGLTAASGRPSNITQLGRRLGALDAGLRARLGEAVDAAVIRALEQAGGRLQSRVSGAGANGKKFGTAFELIRHVPRRLKPATLGREMSRALIGLAEDDGDELMLGNDPWAALLPRYERLVSTTQRSLRAELRRRGMGEHELDLFEEQQTRDREHAWGWLAIALTGVATERLFSPHTAAGPGETPVSLAGIPAGIIREALGRAGGDEIRKTGDGGVLSEKDGARVPAGGPATGDSAQAALSSTGAFIDGYVWRYGDAGARGSVFPPHEDLDGVEFASWTDEILSNTDSFPEVEFFAPGDHDGCECDFWMTLTEGTVGDAEGEG